MAASKVRNRLNFFIFNKIWAQNYNKKESVATEYFTLLRIFWIKVMEMLLLLSDQDFFIHNGIVLILNLQSVNTLIQV